MTWRGPIVLVLLLGIGLAVGYGVAQGVRETPSGDGGAVPVAARSPSVPVDPPPTVLPDPDDPGLATDLPTHRESVGSGGFAITVPVPDRWRRTDLGPAEAKWSPPDASPQTYGLRIEQVTSQRESVSRILQDRIADLDASTEDLVVVAQTADSLEFTYVAGGYLRYGFLRWLDLSGSGMADLEIAVTGREVDVPGARSLLSTVALGAER